MGLHGKCEGVPEKWVHPVYWVEVYKHNVEPVNGNDLWPKFACPTTLIPPKYHVQIGRPKKKRKKSAQEIAEAKVAASKEKRRLKLQNLWSMSTTSSLQLVSCQGREAQ